MTNMVRYNISEAKARFSELVQRAVSGEEVVVSRDNKPLLKLVPLAPPKRSRKPGSAKGQIVRIAPDFDRTPVDFDEYM
jgi:prevent-host-death family protein